VGGHEGEFWNELWDIVRRVAGLIPGAPGWFVPAESIEVLAGGKATSSPEFPPAGGW